MEHIDPDYYRDALTELNYCAGFVALVTANIVKFSKDKAPEMTRAVLEAWKMHKLSELNAIKGMLSDADLEARINAIDKIYNSTFKFVETYSNDMFGFSGI